MMEDKYYTNKISEAAFLMGVKNINLINASRDDDGSIKILLDVSVKDAKNMLFEFPTSEAMKFDRCVLFLKDILFNKRRRG